MTDSSPYTIPFRIQAAAWLYESDRSVKAIREVKDKLRRTYDVEPPRGEQIRKWMDKLFETGSINDSARIGRPSERGDYATNVDASVEANPTLSSRRRSEELNIPRTTLRRILKEDLNYRPFKSVKVQYLSDDDRGLRIKCCRDILNKYPIGRRRNLLFFSDECAFYGDGRNVNSVFWSKENPFFWEQIHQHPPSVMVWAAMSNDHLIGPFFVEGAITSDRYIEMLRTQFIPELQRLGLLYSAHFQQDGAPSHTAHATRNYLNTVFPDRWVGKFGPIAWPARSPDLSSCDNALWGILKRQVISIKCDCVDDLKGVIKNLFENFDKETLKRIHNRTFRRMQLCIDHQGNQVDPFDK